MTRRPLSACHGVARERARARDTVEESGICARLLVKTRLTSGVPYDKLLRNAVLDLTSYFSAKPKSTSTGTFFVERRMFAGLEKVRGKAEGITTKLLT